MDAGPRRPPLGDDPSARHLREGLRILLGPDFRAELRGALSLRRVPVRAVAADDVEEIRAESCSRYLDRALLVRDSLDVASLVRRAISLAVYHRFCREVRRKRSARRFERAAEAWEPERDVDSDPNSELPAFRPGSRRRLGRLPIRGAVVGRARAAIAILLGRVTQSLLTGRGGSPVLPDVEARSTGAIRWLLEFEGDRGAARLARTLVVSRERGTLPIPADLLGAARASTGLRESPPAAVAQLAHAAITDASGSP